jgi:6-methylsalicylate decarboxylase
VAEIPIRDRGLTRRAVLQSGAAIGGAAMLGQAGSPGVAGATARRGTEKGGRIDTHTHFIPPAYREVLDRYAAGGGGFGLQPAWDAELHVAMMDSYGVERALVSISDPGIYFGDQAETTALARTINEFAANLKAAHPGRFGAFAVLPLPDVDAALAELTYALDTLRLDGVGVWSNVGGTYLGASAFDALYAELNRRKVHVFVHPVTPKVLPAIALPAAITEFPFDTTRTVYNLLYSGTLERHPDIRWQLASGGGTVPFLAHRLSIAAKLAPPLAALTPDGPLTYLRRLYYDTGLSDNPQVLKATLETTDVSHVLFGSDWPYGAKLLPPPPDPAPGLALLKPKERRLVERGNALALHRDLGR